MAIMVRDILKLKTLKEMKLVGGSLGLEKSINWVYVAEYFQDPLKGVKWLQGGEIVFITGVEMKSDTSLLKKLIQGISAKNGVGLIINIGQDINSIPKEVIEISDELEIPLFTLPCGAKLVEASEEISNSIILARIEESSITNFFNEAQLTIESQKYQEFNNTIIKYKEIGIYELLLNVKNKDILKNYYFNALSPIIEKDNTSKDILSMKILETYLSENCNITSTAKKLVLHRNTLKYHLKKIQDSLGCNLHNFDECMKLKIALYINKILN